MTPASATNELTVALNNQSGASDTYKLTFIDGSYKYTFTKSGVRFESGKYYAITVKMNAAPVLSAATADDLGKIAGADGYIYDTKAAAEAAGTQAVAMIAICDGLNRFAVQLKAGDKMNWEDAQTYASGLNTSIPIKNCFWFLPAVEHWKAVFRACAVEGDTTTWDALTTAGDSMIIRGFRDKVLATGTTEWGYSCWTSSDVPALLYFYLDELTRVVLFGNPKTDKENVHAFLRLPFPGQG